VKQVSEMPSEAVHGTSSLEITSEAWISNESLLSIELTTFNNVSGMAHPLTTLTTLNYTVDGAGPLSLSDLFLNRSDYLNYISNVCISQLSRNADRDGYQNIRDMILTGASAETKNFKEWVVKNDSLKLIFNVYQVAPYVMGIQTVSIQLSEMTEMIAREGPLEFMYR
jgi:hypothetical protein